MRNALILQTKKAANIMLAAFFLERVITFESKKWRAAVFRCRSPEMQLEAANLKTKMGLRHLKHE